jgi:hypothetical protein
MVEDGRGEKFFAPTDSMIRKTKNAGFQVAFKSRSRRRRGIDVEEYDEEATKI